MDIFDRYESIKERWSKGTNEERIHIVLNELTQHDFDIDRMMDYEVNFHYPIEINGYWYGYRLRLYTMPSGEHDENYLLFICSQPQKQRQEDLPTNDILEKWRSYLVPMTQQLKEQKLVSQVGMYITFPVYPTNSKNVEQKMLQISVDELQDGWEVYQTVKQLMGNLIK